MEVCAATCAAHAGVEITGLVALWCREEIEGPLDVPLLERRGGGGGEEESQGRDVGGQSEHLEECLI